MKRLLHIVTLLIGFNLLVSSCSTTRPLSYAESIVGVWEVTSVDRFAQGVVEKFVPGEYSWVVDQRLVLMNTNYELNGIAFTIECPYYIEGNVLCIATDPTIGYERYQISRLNSSSMVLKGTTSVLYMTRRR